MWHMDTQVTIFTNSSRLCSPQQEIRITSCGRYKFKTMAVNVAALLTSHTQEAVETGRECLCNRNRADHVAVGPTSCSKDQENKHN